MDSRRINGTFFSSIDDFHVTEISLYEPVGEGEHLYIEFEKQGMTTRDVIQRAVSVLGVEERQVGYAGMKDKFATTRQTISIQGAQISDAEKLGGDGVEVISATHHRNKLRVGHLKGNMFRARIRDVGDGDESLARGLLANYAEHGMPNLYGAQRFGRGGSNLHSALSMVREQKKTRIGRWRKKLLASALQSHLFNEYLLSRQSSGEFATVHPGDLLQKVDSGGVFACVEPAVDQARLAAFEVSITGPLFGGRMKRPTVGSLPFEWEQQILDASTVSLAQLQVFGKWAQGARRALRASVSNVSVTADGNDLWLAFQLPPGSYATVLIQQLLAQRPPASTAD